ncbi:hypothetical protein [Duganella sp. BuS-21]|uniref:hypothetical protein n=1 Tax=Duganella sp. BuS-21 TaxID=2943848 RepID=UPI0035A6C871
MLDSGDEKYYGPLFNTAADDTGLAPRRSYYLGYLVAAEIGKTRDLHSMVRLSCGEAHPWVLDALRKLQQPGL